MDPKMIKKIVPKEHKTVRAFPWNETCFGCNGGANEGIGIRLCQTEDGYIASRIHTKECHQGFPGVTHGGIIASYFDEVMWGQTLVYDSKYTAMTVGMSISYLQKVPTGIEVRVIAAPARKEGRHIYVDGYLLLPDDTVAVTAKAHYIEVRKTDMISEEEMSRIKHCWNPDEQSIWF